MREPCCRWCNGRTVSIVEFEDSAVHTACQEIERLVAERGQLRAELERSDKRNDIHVDRARNAEAELERVTKERDEARKLIGMYDHWAISAYEAVGKLSPADADDDRFSDLADEMRADLASIFDSYPFKAVRIHDGFTQYTAERDANRARIEKLEAALRDVIEVFEDRQAYVMNGPRFVAKAEQIARRALEEK